MGLHLKVLRGLAQVCDVILRLQQACTIGLEASIDICDA